MKGLKVVIALMAVALALVAATPANAQETTSVRPGGLYTVEVTVTKPSGMSLPSGSWEVRFYIYSGNSCFNGGEWTNFDESGGPYLYTGYWDYRVWKEAWTTQDTQAWSTSIQVVNSDYSNGPRSSPDYLNGVPGHENETMENLVYGSVTLRARLMFTDLIPKFEGDQVTFKIAATSYTYKFQLDSYGRYWLKNPDDTDVGSGAYFDMSEGTGEWRLNYRSDVTLLLSDDNSVPISGKIVVSSPILIGLASAGMDITLLAAVGGVVMVVAVVAIVMFRRKKGGELAAPDMAPPSPSAPEAPPAPPKSPEVPGFTLPQA
jgi:hypothetical protein